MEDDILDLLDEKRRKHTLGVIQTSEELAMIHGVDKKKVRTAALFHDICKNISKTELNILIEKNDLAQKYNENINLAHSKLAAIKMEELYNISDEEVLNAVKFHTTGRPKMSDVEKVIFVADAIEPNRTYNSVEKIRNIAKNDLDNACFVLLDETIKLITDRGEYLDEETIFARDYYRKEVGMDNEQIAYIIKDILENKKAEDVEVMDIAEKSSFADFFVIATGNSDRQVSSLVDEVEDKMAENDILAKSIEGKNNNSGWILLDFGDIIVNIFTKEMREKYSLEEIWGRNAIPR